MRVIAGEFKGRPIKSVSNRLTRPTSDKVKESLFNRIGPFFHQGIGLDLFAGSGGLGIEALSRGLDHVIFVDQQKQACDSIKQNIQTLKLTDRSEVYRNDAFRALKPLSKRDIQFDFIFLDPPYKKNVYEKLLNQLYDYQLTHKQTLVICEHDANLSLPKAVGEWQQVRSETYGSQIAISLYERKDV
ncbi:16S rRNA (guanine966-N2)-methyltransferase [Pelagirhabdus alkalitolerans]|uniref:16S rRNA (Guanine966-N2)-methyltransferase n=1 Tax=Pelagirhabdus alkalitolerans TaxID=1612202 RepID=A0A1G6GZC3_9BACI|nr:16S rRNA (guanine(966)-N(2))-methyltransferase RsmD [Pelagirhabdus alkalitolerans]SDB87397.1 16S rRNA (guanine966-N2)-methyltransferase [Pelagirhabdus alkalitolerans]